MRLARDDAVCAAAIKRGDREAAAADLNAFSMEALKSINDLHAEWGFAGLDAIPAWMGIKLGLYVSQVVDDLINLNSKLDSGKLRHDGDAELWTVELLSVADSDPDAGSRPFRLLGQPSRWPPTSRPQPSLCRHYRRPRSRTSSSQRSSIT